MSPPTMSDELTSPELLLCKTPAVENVGNVNPVAEKAARVTPLTITSTTFVPPILNPVFVPPLNSSEGAVVVPAGTVRLPLSVPPVRGKFKEAKPVKLAVIVPAEKLPETSRDTIALALFAFVAVVAELATKPDAVRVASLLLPIAALPLISASTINEDDTKPLALLCKIPDDENAGKLRPAAATFTTADPLALSVN